MEDFMENPGLIHIGERILKQLDIKTQGNCRLVRKSWNQVLEIEASKCMKELETLLELMKKSCFPPNSNVLSFAQYLKLKVKESRKDQWRTFTEQVRFKVHNPLINNLLLKHIKYQFNLGFSSWPLPYFSKIRNKKMVDFILQEPLLGYIKRVQRVQRGNYTYKPGFEDALQKAISYGYTDIVQCFKPYMDIEHYNEYIFDPAWHGQLRILKILIPNPNEPLMVDSEGNNPIHIAASKGHIEIVKYFVGNTEGLRAQNKYGHTPLQLAKVNNHHEVVKFLVECEQRKNE